MRSLWPILCCAMLPAGALADGPVNGLVENPVETEHVEAPCWAAGVEVICPKEDFKSLMGLLLDYRADAAECALKLTDCTNDTAALRAALNAKPKVVTPPVVEPPTARIATSFIVGMVSTALFVVAPFLPAEVPSTVRWILVGTGVLGAAIAFKFNLP